MKKCTKTVVLLAALFVSSFSLIGAESNRLSSKRSFDQKSTAKNYSLNIDPALYAPIGNNNLANIEISNSNDAKPLLQFDYSPLNNGVAVTSFELPANLRENKAVVVELEFLTNNEIESVEGRVLFAVEAEITHKDGTVEKAFGSTGMMRNALQVKSAHGNKIANYYKTMIGLMGANIQKEDVVSLKLIRKYKISENYRGSVSIVDTKVHWNVNKSFLKPVNTKTCDCPNACSCTPWTMSCTPPACG